jgi:2-polyprenyl-3-methyl-5-hydroxy-6-metoxy-1,4-benzoquinol methylase
MCSTAESACDLEQVSCNLCGVRRERLLYHRPYRLEGASDCACFAATTDHFHDYGRIVRCAGCGLVYTNPRPRSKELLKGYASCVDEMYLAESSSRSINALLSLRMIKRFAPSGRLLEVGCAAGYFLNAARIDFEVVGVDPSDWACRIAREKFKLEVYAEDFESMCHFDPESLDVIAMIDVVEHLGDPRSALHRAATLLKPGGILYLVTPDIGSLSARLLGGYWWGLRPAHLYYFEATTVRRLLKGCGFDVIAAKSFGRIFSYGYWVSRMRHYPRWAYQGLNRIVHTLDIEDKPLYLDTRDSIEVCARRG